MQKLTTFRGYLAKSVLAVALTSTASAVNALSLEGTVWEAAGKNKGIAPELLYAVALAESQRPVDQRSGHARPWPWTLNVAGKPYYFDSRDAATKTLNDYLAKGVESIDVGVMQVNLLWHGFRVESPEMLFDIETSARIGADILSEAIASYPRDYVIGVGRYHHWADSNIARQYGLRVLRYEDAIRRVSGGQ